MQEDWAKKSIVFGFSAKNVESLFAEGPLHKGVFSGMGFGMKITTGSLPCLPERVCALHVCRILSVGGYLDGTGGAFLRLIA